MSQSAVAGGAGDVLGKIPNIKTNSNFNSGLSSQPNEIVEFSKKRPTKKKLKKYSVDYTPGN